MPTKAELRKIYLARRKNLSALERKRRSEEIAGRFFARFDLSDVDFLHCFLPIEKFNEVDTRLIFQRIWQDFPHVETLVPRVNFATGEIENLKFTLETELAQNRWEIHEPAHDDLIETEKIDLVLVPLLCFDHCGFRVGYGKGFYDRLLRRCRPDCLKIGLSFDPPIAEISDTNDFDVKLDYCVSPEEIFNIFNTKTQERKR